MAVLRIATRSSPLALWQARHVAALLQARHPALEVELVEVSTEGDRDRSRPIVEMAGRGVFVKEVQAAVIDGRADLAVHSAKDLTSGPTPGLVLAAFPPRGDVRDALVGSTLAGLPTAATVASGSARRRAMLADLRPDLRFVELRGNMHTRVARAADGDVDAVVVAAVALDRLGLGDRIAERLDPTQVIPQVGQGALAVEAREGDGARLVGPIDDPGRGARSAPSGPSSPSSAAAATSRSGPGRRAVTARWTCWRSSPVATGASCCAGGAAAPTPSRRARARRGALRLDLHRRAARAVSGRMTLPVS